MRPHGWRRVHSVAFRVSMWATTTALQTFTPRASLWTPRGPIHQLHKLSTHCASLRPTCGPPRQLRKLKTPWASSVLRRENMVLTRCTQPGCEGEGRRARPGCGGERGEGTCGRSWSALLAPRAYSTAETKDRVSQTHTSLPPLYTMHSQMICSMCSRLVGLWRMYQAYLFCACTRDTSGSSAFLF